MISGPISRFLESLPRWIEIPAMITFVALVLAAYLWVPCENWSYLPRPLSKRATVYWVLGAAIFLILFLGAAILRL